MKILRGAQNRSSEAASRPAFRGAPSNRTKLAENRSKTTESEDVVPKPTPTFPEIKAMPNAMRLIDDADSMEFLDFCKEYLMDGNKGFTVVGAIGGQSTGKSTVLSMLAGNDPSDMYRQYAFRPFYREGGDSTRHQTTKIYVYINKWRTVFLDCQAIGSATLLSDFLRSHRRLTRDQATDQFELMSLQILTLMTKICHTLLLCIDSFIDMNIVGDLLRTEVFKEKIGESTERKVNIVVLHQKAKSDAFEPLVILERMRTLKSVFENSAFDVCGGVNLATLGFRRYRWMDCDVNYIPMSEMAPLKFGRSTSSHHSDAETPRDGSVPYAKIIYALRTKLFTLPRPSFSNFSQLGTSEITELEWFTSASKQWDRILKELKVGFNDTLHRRDRYSRGGRHSPKQHQRRVSPGDGQLPDEIKHSELDENSEVVATDGKDANYSERRREVYASPPRRRRIRNRRQGRRNFDGDAAFDRNTTAPMGAGSHRVMRRQFFVDERDDMGEKMVDSAVEGVSPGRYRIKKRPSSKKVDEADSQSEEYGSDEKTREKNKGGDDDDGTGPETGSASCCGEDDVTRRRRASCDSRHELEGATSTDEKGAAAEAEEEPPRHDDKNRASAAKVGADFDGRRRNRISVARRNEVGSGAYKNLRRNYATDTSFREGVNIDKRHYEAVRQQIFASTHNENEPRSSGESKFAQRNVKKSSPELGVRIQRRQRENKESAGSSGELGKKRLEGTQSPSDSSNVANDEGQGNDVEDPEEQVHDAFCSQESG